jgi:hypothetical protein
MDLPSANQALIQLTSPDGLRVGEVAALSIVDVQIRKVREQCESGMARNERCRSTRRHGDPSAFICSPIKGVETLTPSSLALTANDFREYSAVVTELTGRATMSPTKSRLIHCDILSH